MAIECRVCRKPNPEHIFHCAEHYKCDGCGTTEGLCTHRDRLMCDSCNQVEVAKRIAAFSGDTDFTSKAVCPHCGYESSDSYELTEGVMDCDQCGLAFELSREVQVTYCTRKV